MRKTQIELPDALYSRAKRFADAQEMSLGEVARRSLEQFLDRQPGAAPRNKNWRLPIVDAGGPIALTADELKEITLNEESLRSLTR
jgi:predicted transcriptional regulator